MTYLNAVGQTMLRSLKWLAAAFVAALAVSIVVAAGATQDVGEATAHLLGTVIGWGIVASPPVAAVLAWRDMTASRRSAADPVDGTPGGQDAPPQ